MQMAHHCLHYNLQTLLNLRTNERPGPENLSNSRRIRCEMTEVTLPAEEYLPIVLHRAKGPTLYVLLKPEINVSEP